MARYPGILGGVALIGLLASGDAAAGEREVAREFRWVDVDPAGAVPGELTHPEGRTRWEARELPVLRVVARRVEIDPERPGAVERVERGEGQQRLRLTVTRWEDFRSGDAAQRWLLPQRFDLASPDLRPPLELVRSGPDGAEPLRIVTRRVGAGWVFLPSGAHQVALERALILRGDPATHVFMPYRLEHRFIDARVGVVAVVGGPVSADGSERALVDELGYLESQTLGTEPMKVYIDKFDPPLTTRLTYGFDRGENTPVSSLTPDGYTTIGDLIAASSWDFSQNDASNAVAEVASTLVPVSQEETCNYNQCGFTVPDARLGREDRNFDDPASLQILLSVTQVEERPNDTTIWLRAGVQNEGATGSLADGESRFCHVGVDGDGRPRPDVPLWRFAHEDSPGGPRYMTIGDSWANDTPFNCEQSVFNHVCPNACGFLCPTWIKGCSGSADEGTQGSVVLGSGPVTLPSGHTFDALLVKNVVDFCAYLGNSCNFAVQAIHTVNYFWEVPGMGTAVRLRSELNASSDTAFTTLNDTDIKFGLLPPLSIAVGQVGETSVELTWDPGRDVRYIDGYRVHWDTDSGASTPYANVEGSLDVVGGQVTFAPCTQNPDMTTTCSATIDGLAPGTEYFFTVTSLSIYNDPATQADTVYESLVFPVTLDGATTVPAEVSATTPGGGCLPSAEVGGLTASRVAGGAIELCWTPVMDPCVDGYAILGADTPTSSGGFTTLVEDTGLVSCQTIDPTQSYFLVVGAGGGGTGPWGHFGQ